MNLRDTAKGLYRHKKDAWEILEVHADWKDAQQVTIFQNRDIWKCDNSWVAHFFHYQLNSHRQTP